MFGIIIIIITFIGLPVGIAFALSHGINIAVYNGQRKLSNLILVVSVLGIFGTVALFIAEVALFF